MVDESKIRGNIQHMISFIDSDDLEFIERIVYDFAKHYSKRYQEYRSASKAYSREECPFVYCDSPADCKSINYCRHRTSLKKTQ